LLNLNAFTGEEDDLPGCDENADRQNNQPPKASSYFKPKALAPYQTNSRPTEEDPTHGCELSYGMHTQTPMYSVLICPDVVLNLLSEELRIIG
jgi:hypothetical protein